MTRILLIFFVLITGFTFSQKPNRTIKDTTFKIGDIIQLPKILIQETCHGCSENGINFDTRDSLSVVANFIKKYPMLIFQLDNHTDQRGNAAKNKKLSQKRADAARQYLIKNCGIDSTRIFAKGFGGLNPVFNKDDILKAKSQEEKESLHEKNRRTELRVIEQK